LFVLLNKTGEQRFILYSGSRIDHRVCQHKKQTLTTYIKLWILNITFYGALNLHMFTFVNHVQYFSLAHLRYIVPWASYPILLNTHVKVGIPLWSEVMEFHHIVLKSFLSHLCKRYIIEYYILFEHFFFDCL